MRQQLLLTEGRDALLMAQRNFSDAIELVGCNVGHGFDFPAAPWWIYPGSSSFRSGRCVKSVNAKPDAEKVARQAVNHAVIAFNLLDDLELQCSAHILIHEIGMFISRHFGCTINQTADGWTLSCPVILSHFRMGMSPGFSATRHCSICGADFSECPHRPGELYEVTVADTSRCPCGVSGCQSHSVGEQLVLAPSGVVRTGKLQEISWVTRPRDPYARMNSITFSNAKMATITRSTVPDGAVAECFHCRQACTGLWDGDTVCQFLTAG